MRGGIERAFMSTTFDRAAALHYASQPGKPAIVFEMQMGMLDRGAELGWLSQARFTISPELLPISTELPTISPELPPISPEHANLTDLGWLSQYPHEKEILFAPLTVSVALPRSPASCTPLAPSAATAAADAPLPPAATSRARASRSIQSASMVQCSCPRFVSRST